MREVGFLFTLMVAAASGALGQNYNIGTYAGGGLPSNIQGLSANLSSVVSVAADKSGGVYLALADFYTVVHLDSNGLLTAVAGRGSAGFSGDGGAATSAELTAVNAVAVDSAGNVYIADQDRIRKVSGGIISTIAGTGVAGYSGDNGPATVAQFDTPYSIAVDGSGNVFIADTNNHRVRKISNGVVTTVAGSGANTFGVDNISAVSSALSQPFAVKVDGAGNLFLLDGSYRVRKVTNGIITTVAGNMTQGFVGDGGAATGAAFNEPNDFTMDASGNIYIADSANERIRRVSRGIITTVAGNGTAAFGGDGGAAASAQLSYPIAVDVDASGNLYIADFSNSRVRKVTGGIINTVAGNGNDADGVDNGPAILGNVFGP